MAIEQGTILEIHLEPAKAHLASDHASGVGILAVDDAYPFNEPGGQVQMPDGVILTYTECDMEENLLTLSGTTAAAYAQDDEVFVYPRGHRKIAVVDIDDGEEPIRAIISHADRGNWVDGIRDPDEQEAVLVDDSSGRWMVTTADEENLVIPWIEGWPVSNQAINAQSPNWVGLDFHSFDSDSVGITYINQPGTDVFRIERSGLYLIAGQVTVGEYDGTDKVRMRVSIGGVEYAWRYPNTNTVEPEINSFTMMRRLTENDEIFVEAQVTNGSPTFARSMRLGRGQTRLTIAFLAD